MGHQIRCKNISKEGHRVTSQIDEGLSTRSLSQSTHLPIPKETTDEAKNWLAQHIKNSDYAVSYKQMDDKHVRLFDIIRDVKADLNNQELWYSLQALYNEHFRAEEALFTTIRDNKHDIADHRHDHKDLRKF